MVCDHIRNRVYSPPVVGVSERTVVRQKNGIILQYPFPYLIAVNTHRSDTAHLYYGGKRWNELAECAGYVISDKWGV